MSSDWVFKNLNNIAFFATKPSSGFFPDNSSVVAGRKSPGRVEISCRPPLLQALARHRHRRLGRRRRRQSGQPLQQAESRSARIRNIH